MHLTDHFNNKAFHKFIYNNILLEQRFGGYEDEPQQAEEQPSIDPLENVKKYILFRKLKQIKKSLDQQPHVKEINDIIQYLNIIIDFFNGFQYNDLVTYINDILNTIAQFGNIKVDFDLQYPEPEPVPVEKPEPVPQ